MKTRFVLPETKTCVVVWYRDGVKHETLIDTPRRCDYLYDLMLMKHHVGWSEIRAVKAVSSDDLVTAMTSWR